MGRGEIQARFAALARGDWGRLVTMWRSDLNAVMAREERRDRQQGRVMTSLQKKEMEEDRTKRQALQLIGTYEVGKAEDRMNSDGVASLTDPMVQQQMASKYPPREREIPDRVLKGQAVPILRGLRKGLQTVRRKRASGCGGLRAEFLQVIGEHMEAEHLQLLEAWGLRFLQGELAPWLYVVWLSIQTVPLYKTATRDTVRPIGMVNSLYKLINRLISGRISLSWYLILNLSN